MSGDGTSEPESGPLAAGDLAGYRDGGVIRFEPQGLPGKSGSRPLTLQSEVKVATGKRGGIAALAQTAAIQNVLDWLASRSPGKTRAKARERLLRVSNPVCLACENMVVVPRPACQYRHWRDLQRAAADDPGGRDSLSHGLNLWLPGGV
jgi:hypothetical protein